jgi:hypothetical protein
MVSFQYEKENEFSDFGYVRKSAFLKMSRKQEKYFKKASQRTPSNMHPNCKEDSNNTFKPEINDRILPDRIIVTPRTRPFTSHMRESKVSLIDKLKPVQVENLPEILTTTASTAHLLSRNPSAGRKNLTITDSVLNMARSRHAQPR